MQPTDYFFKEERQKILKIVLPKDGEEVLNDPKSEDYIDDEMFKRLKKDENKVSFDEMGKLIGSRWKYIDPDRLNRYSELASEDAERYKKEMKDYNLKQEAKMRTEAVKPPAPAYPLTPTSAARARDMGGGVPGMDPRAAAGYPAEMQAYGGYYGGYGMEYGYGGYGYYPPPPQGGAGGSPEQMRSYGGENPYAMYSQYPPMVYDQGGYPPQVYGEYPPQGYGDPYGYPPQYPPHPNGPGQEGNGAIGGSENGVAGYPPSYPSQHQQQQQEQEQAQAHQQEQEQLQQEHQ